MQNDRLDLEVVNAGFPDAPRGFLNFGKVGRFDGNLRANLNLRSLAAFFFGQIRQIAQHLLEIIDLVNLLTGFGRAGVE